MFINTLIPKINTYFNFIGNIQATIFKNSEIINKISKYFKPNNKVTFNKKKISHSPKIQFSRCKKLEKWGWKAKMGLEEGIKKYAIWFKKIN